MKKWLLSPRWAILIAGLCLQFLPQMAHADLNILPLGDSLTSGKNPSNGVEARASYRPFLWDTMNNFLGNGANNPAGVEVDFVGLESGPSQPPAGTPSFDPHHQSVGGLTTQSYSKPTSGNFIGSKLGSLESLGEAPDIAIILLGTNDVYMNAGGGKNRGNPLGLDSGLGVVGDIAQIADILKNGYTDGSGQIAAGNEDIEILLGAIPPVDARRRWDPQDSEQRISLA